MEKSDLELIMSSLYFFYADRVFKGLDTKKTAELGWYLPKKTILCQPIILLASRPQLNQQTTRRPSRTILPLKRILQSYIILQKRAGIQLSFQKIKSLQPRDT
jgi:hypothetical protein